jgi:hypothetical protein
MKLLLPATALALAFSLAALPAAAQSGGASGGGASGGTSGGGTGASPSGASPSTDGSQSGGATQSDPTGRGATQSNPDGQFSDGASSRQRSDDEDSRAGGRGQQAETQRCVSKFLALDKDGDGALSAREYDRIRTAGKDVDRNNDGKMNRSEIRNACATGTLSERDISG